MSATQTSRGPIPFKVELGRGTYAHETITTVAPLRCVLIHGVTHQEREWGTFPAGTVIELPADRANPYWLPEDGPRTVYFYVREGQSVYQYWAYDRDLATATGLPLDAVRGQ